MKAFISYQENGKDISGFFELLEQNNNYIKISTTKNILIIPYHKVNKIKIEYLKGGDKI